MIYKCKPTVFWLLKGRKITAPIQNSWKMAPTNNPYFNTSSSIVGSGANSILVSSSHGTNAEQRHAIGRGKIFARDIWRVAQELWQKCYKQLLLRLNDWGFPFIESRKKKFSGIPSWKINASKLTKTWEVRFKEWDQGPRSRWWRGPTSRRPGRGREDVGRHVKRVLTAIQTSRALSSLTFVRFIHS